MAERICVGAIAGAFGVRGEVRVTAYTADPLALTAYGPLLRADGSPGLTLTSAPLSTISNELGFSSDSNLQRMFKELTRLTPMQYRQRFSRE